jgi:hypothetical protein
MAEREFDEAIVTRAYLEIVESIPARPAARPALLASTPPINISNGR